MKSELRSLMLRLRSHSFSFSSYGLKAKARAKDFLHKAFNYLHLKIEIQTQHLLVAIMLFICCTRNFDYIAGKWKADELQIKISNGLLTAIAQNLAYIISVNPSTSLLFNQTGLHSLM